VHSYVLEHFREYGSHCGCQGGRGKKREHTGLLLVMKTLKVVVSLGNTLPLSLCISVCGVYNIACKEVLPEGEALQ